MFRLGMLRAGHASGAPVNGGEFNVLPCDAGGPHQGAESECVQSNYAFCQFAVSFLRPFNFEKLNLCGTGGACWGQAP